MFGELSEGVVTGVCCVLGSESTLEALHGVVLWHWGGCVCVQGGETRSKLARSFFLRNLFLILKYEGSRKRVLLWSSCCQMSERGGSRGSSCPTPSFYDQEGDWGLKDP